MALPTLLSRLKRTPPPAEPPRESGSPFDTYEARVPSPQNCIDAIPGWVSEFPREYNLKAGHFPGFIDERIHWVIDRYGPIGGANVLELGPMEAAHTTMLDRAGANVTAVEANKQAFLKCLVTKELVGLPRAKFLLGDCVQYLEQIETRYDMIVACGVLYHMPDPLRFLTAVAARTDVLYIWTSFIDEDVLEPGSELANGFAAMRETTTFLGAPITLYRLNYNGVHQNEDFCGGIYNTPRWMSRASILAALRALGFTSIEIAHENRPLPHQPCFSVFARRGATAGVPE